jgi:hypothetical protein
MSEFGLTESTIKERAGLPWKNETGTRRSVNALPFLPVRESQRGKVLKRLRNEITSGLPNVWKGQPSR